MQDPAGLYQLNPDITDVPEGLHLVAGLTGFADAGAAVSQFTDSLHATLTTRALATFDADILLDYRARRPIIYFDQDHLTDYQPAKLALYLANDEVGQPFLLLTGFEPDFQWDRFTAAVLQLVERFKVKSITWVHAIPMPVPHTRPINVTVSGNRTELIDTMSVWKPHTQVPANALHLIEYLLQEIGHLGHRVRSAGTRIIFRTPNTRMPRSRRWRASAPPPVSFLPPSRCGRKAASSSTKSTAKWRPIKNSRGWSARWRNGTTPTWRAIRCARPLTDEDGELPTADEIAAELEKFLALRRGGDDDRARSDTRLDSAETYLT